MKTTTNHGAEIELPILKPELKAGSKVKFQRITHHPNGTVEFRLVEAKVLRVTAPNRVNCHVQYKNGRKDVVATKILTLA